ncbi:MAG: hypothetical protein Q4D02_06135 [Clostridia bacterium]|nr:hypothetical protein [Clostridia bacterium]
MELEEYLKERLNITSEEATKIANVFKEYKKKYGHEHFHKHKNDDNEDVYSMICESKEDCIESEYNLEKMHCNGCRNNCTILDPKCGKGSMIQKEIIKMKTK